MVKTNLKVPEATKITLIRITEGQRVLAVNGLLGLHRKGRLPTQAPGNLAATHRVVTDRQVAILTGGLVADAPINGQ